MQKVIGLADLLYAPFMLVAAVCLLSMATGGDLSPVLRIAATFGGLIAAGLALHEWERS